MEVITVVYYLDSDMLDGRINKRAIPNAFQLILPYDRADIVTLLDVIRYLYASTSNKGSQSNFSSKSLPYNMMYSILLGDRIFQLKSIFSVIWKRSAQSDNTVTLLISKLGSLPMHELSLMEEFVNLRSSGTVSRWYSAESQNLRQSSSQSAPQNQSRSQYAEPSKAPQRRVSVGEDNEKDARKAEYLANKAPPVESSSISAEQVTKSLYSFASFATTSLKHIVSTAQAAVTESVDTFGQASSILHTESMVLSNGTKVNIVRQIAEGGFGTVYLAQALSSGNVNGETVNAFHSGYSDTGSNKPSYYALKKLNCQSSENCADASNELKMLLTPKFKENENIIHLVDHLSEGNGFFKQFYFLFDYFPEGNCFDKIDRYMMYTQKDSNLFAAQIQDQVTAWPFPEREALQIIRGVANALVTIHSCGFSHRDVKPHNVLLQYSSGRVTPVLMDLGSMGLAKSTPITTRSQALVIEDMAATYTSPAYRPPELTSVPQSLSAYFLSIGATNPYPSNFDALIIDERVDIWSLGCTMFCLAFGLSPFESLKEGVMKLAILNGRYTIPHPVKCPMRPGMSGASGEAMRCSYSNGFCIMIQRMLAMDFLKRPSAKEVFDACNNMLK